MIKKKKLPVGIHDFAELIQKNYYFVDKSLLVKEILDSGAKVTLIPRPRRFGKTLNLSLLQYFFEKPVLSSVEGTEQSNRALFDGLKISQEPECMAEQGQYPVIFLTFKDVKEQSWAACYGKIKQLVADEVLRHSYLLESNKLAESEKENLKAMINQSADQALLENALKNLSAYLNKYHGKPTVILLDEYDSPIQAGFLNNYYDDIINFMRGLLSAGLKDNSNLAFGIITGILRVAKESIFSGMNNLKVCSMVTQAYSDKFGLLEDEVADALAANGLAEKLTAVRAWYNGYSSGKNTVYNPWSIINFIDNHGTFQPYWVNTSDNQLIKNLIEQHADELTKLDLEALLQKQSIKKVINENIIFQTLYHDIDHVWNLFLFTGYLTFKNYHQAEDSRWYADLVSPNQEVFLLWHDIIKGWFASSSQQGSQRYLKMLNGLKAGNSELFIDLFYEFMDNSASYFDMTGKEPERVYHALVLGMLVGLVGEYEVKSNRESGTGRYDVMLIPLKPGLRGYIFEFKKIAKKETLKTAVDAALKQIEEKKYEQELRARGVTDIVKLAIAFEGKQALVKEG